VSTTDRQVVRLMEELSRNGKKGLAALRAGMDPKTARKWRKLGKLPSEMKQPRTWKTRPDPFEEDWPQVVGMLESAPELEAKTIFEELRRRAPQRYEPGQLRTLQRHMRRWRAAEGPPKEVYFAQKHRPGEAMQTDFTWATQLLVHIAGQLFEHMLCHVVLPYSNWTWATVCHSESMAALKKGLQAALFRLGRVPQWHQTDNSTAATHDLATGKRAFNAEYLTLMGHFGMEPRTIEVGQKNQNGDVESLNGAFKRRLEQHLLLRQSREFDTVPEYEEWLEQVLEKGNRLRGKRLAEEVAVMRPVVATRMPDFTELEVRVSEWSTIRVKFNAYSVPSRLRGEIVRVRLYEERLEVYYAGQRELVTERLRGRGGHQIDYRHIIWSLVRKPRAFARYRYREELFPGVVFRQAYDALCAVRSPQRADVEYLRILHLAASTSQSEVERVLELFVGSNELPLAERVGGIVSPQVPSVPVLAELTVDLGSYDELLGPVEEAQG
jgi:Mu transposase, C-terminal domain